MSYDDHDYGRDAYDRQEADRDYEIEVANLMRERERNEADCDARAVSAYSPGTVRLIDDEPTPSLDNWTQDRQ